MVRSAQHSSRVAHCLRFGVMTPEPTWQPQRSGREVRDHPGPSPAQVADPDQLTAAWEDVLAGDRNDGMLGSEVAWFARDAEQNLAEMAAQLSAGSYRPGRLAPVSLPRADGHARLLHVPVVRDRVVERSILAVLAVGISTGQRSWALGPPRWTSCFCATAPTSGSRSGLAGGRSPGVRATRCQRRWSGPPLQR
jgi:hypothetical protein